MAPDCRGDRSLSEDGLAYLFKPRAEAPSFKVVQHGMGSQSPDPTGRDPAEVAFASDAGTVVVRTTHLMWAADRAVCKSRPIPA